MTKSTRVDDRCCKMRKCSSEGKGCCAGSERGRKKMLKDHFLKEKETQRYEEREKEEKRYIDPDGGNDSSAVPEIR